MSVPGARRPGPLAPPGVYDVVMSAAGPASRPDPANASAAPEPADAPPASFEAAMDELEKILAELERGDISLEQSLARYRRGTLLIQHCRKVLTDAERQVELLTRGPDGSVQTRPMDNA